MTKIIIFFSLGYILIAGITAGIYAGVCGNEDPTDAYKAFRIGIFWPIYIPIHIILFIVAVIAVPIECLIEHIASSNTTSNTASKKVQKTTDDDEHSPFLDKCGEQYVPN